MGIGPGLTHDRSAFRLDPWEIRGHRKDGTEGVFIVLWLNRVIAACIAKDNPRVALVNMRTGDIIEGREFEALKEKKT